MITAADLAKLKIQRTIFHDVPKRPKGTDSKPVLADLETQVDANRADMLRRRMIQVLGSKSSYPVEFSSDTGSRVPQEVRSYTAKPGSSEQFVEMSKRLAMFLFEQHTGATSPGLLCVINVASGGHQGLALLKLEREEGAELKFREQNGKRIFDMSVLDNLILTEGTRLFKTALFLRIGPNDDDFKATACDSQWTVVTSSDVALFWLRYLGCRFTEEPRVSTEKWFEATIRFANEHVTDPIAKNDLYEHLHSELKSNRKTVSPRKFIEDCLPDKYRNPYEGFLKQRGVSLHAFQKDTADIKGRLRRRAYHTEKGISVTVPEEEVRVVEVEKQKIVVHDQLISIDRK
jgi:37-kD nucleoid-associated bacterial protein